MSQKQNLKSTLRINIIGELGTGSGQLLKKLRKCFIVADITAMQNYYKIGQLHPFLGQSIQKDNMNNSFVFFSWGNRQLSQIQKTKNRDLGIVPNRIS